MFTIVDMHSGKRPANVQVFRVDRQTLFGNPFPITRDRTREQSVAQFAKWLRDNPDQRSQAIWDHIGEVKAAIERGEALGCWCHNRTDAPQRGDPLVCHADVLYRAAMSEWRP